jgi:hypothetical protein
VFVFDLTPSFSSSCDNFVSISNRTAGGGGGGSAWSVTATFGTELTQNIQLFVLFEYDAVMVIQPTGVEIVDNL